MRFSSQISSKSLLTITMITNHPYLIKMCLRSATNNISSKFHIFPLPVYPHTCKTSRGLQCNDFLKVLYRNSNSVCLALYSIEQREYSVTEPDTGITEFIFKILREGNTAVPSTVGKY